MNRSTPTSLGIGATGATCSPAIPSGSRLVASTLTVGTVKTFAQTLKMMSLAKELVETDDPDVGAAHIACSGSFATLLYPHLLRLMHDAPGLQVHLEAAPRRSVLAGVLEDGFDLGILGEDPRHPRLEARQIVGGGQLLTQLVTPAPRRRHPVQLVDGAVPDRPRPESHRARLRHRR